MPNDTENMLARLVLMQMDVVPGSDAVPVFFYAQEAPIFWVNRIVNVSIQLESEQLQINT